MSCDGIIVLVTDDHHDIQRVKEKSYAFMYETSFLRKNPIF